MSRACIRHLETADKSNIGLKRVIPTVALLILAGIYIAAGAVKIIDPKEFARMILGYRLAPETLVPAIAVVLPWWEVVAGVLSLVSRFRRGALAILAGLSAIFFIIGAITLLRGLSPACGCFGLMSERVGMASLSLEFLLTLISVLLLQRELKRNS